MLDMQNEAAARAWIEAFFFMCLQWCRPMKQWCSAWSNKFPLRIPSTAVKPSGSITLHGFIDYTAATAVKSVVGEIVACLT